MSEALEFLLDTSPFEQKLNKAEDQLREFDTSSERILKKERTVRGPEILSPVIPPDALPELPSGAFTGQDRTENRLDEIISLLKEIRDLQQKNIPAETETEELPVCVEYL